MTERRPALSLVAVPGRRATTVELASEIERRGFSGMSPEKQKAIASLGGKASHAQGVGYEWNSETARAAGRKGGAMGRGGRGKAKIP